MVTDDPLVSKRNTCLFKSPNLCIHLFLSLCPLLICLNRSLHSSQGSVSSLVLLALHCQMCLGLCGPKHSQRYASFLSIRGADGQEMRMDIQSASFLCHTCLPGHMHSARHLVGDPSWHGDRSDVPPATHGRLDQQAAAVINVTTGYDMITWGDVRISGSLSLFWALLLLVFFGSALFLFL